MSIFAGKLLFWFPLIYVYLINTIILAQPNFINYNPCENTENYTINDMYRQNLDATLSVLPTTNSGLGFFNFSTGEGNDTVHSIALCRGDVAPDACSSCLNDSIANLRKLCLNKKEAIGIYDFCLLQYSNNALLVYPQNKDYFYQFNPNITTDLDGFNGALRPLMEELIGAAAAGGQLLKFATSSTAGPGTTTIYGLVQCAPYLTAQQCRDCLEDEVGRISLNDNGKVGGKIVLGTCNFRFEINPFYSKDTLVAPPPSFPSSAQGKLLFLFPLIYINLTITVILAQPNFINYTCNNAENYTVNSIYQRNLNTTLSALPTTNSGLGFFNFSTGEGNDTVHSIALCRGDVSPVACDSCLNDSIAKLPTLCPNQKEATGLYDYCLLQYSDNPLLSYPQPKDYFWQFNPQNATDIDGFIRARRSLLNKLLGSAAAGGPLLKFASGSAAGPNSTTIYGLVQCAPYLTEQQCRECVEDEVTLIGVNDNRKIGGKFVLPSCNFRFEIYPFYDHSTLATPRPSPLSPPGIKKNTTRTMITVAVIAAIIVSVIISLACIYMRLRKKNKHTPPRRVQSETIDIGTVESLQYNFRAIKAGTNDFSEENKLGAGGFGVVYKGKLVDGREVAVKRLAKDSGQRDLEFKNEVLIVAKLQHRNLARLLGFSIEGSERLLIYEYLPNASLDKFIFDPTERTFLSWEKRHNIIKGVAKGLLYLHEDSRLRIIHRDLKASNVLLDENMNAKIEDFGMAKLFKPEETQGNTRRIVGTYGYMAPEYVKHGQFSVKSDVYSFGVLVLEMITGQKNQSFRNEDNTEFLLGFAWESWRNGAGANMIDPRLRTRSCSLCDIIRSIHIGLLCVQENILNRPTMAMVVLMLNSLSMTLPAPSEPGFYNIRRNISETRQRSSQFSVNDVTKSDVFPR